MLGTARERIPYVVVRLDSSGPQSRPEIMTTPWPYMGQAVPRMKPITQPAAPQRPAHAIFFTIGLLPDGAPERFNCRFESRLGKEVPAPRCLIAHAKHSVSEEIFRRTPCHVRLSTTRRRVELYEVVLETLIDL